MNYFIDFEATQFSNEIISIGCVDENENTFYSEVHADKKVGKLVEELVSLTSETIKNAPMPDIVFTSFFNWISEHINEQESVTFYTYGNCDIKFLNKELHKVSSYKAKAAILLMINNLVDYSITVKHHFKLSNDVSLIKVLSYYRNEDILINQSHNSLEDAQYLKEIYNQISKDENIYIPEENPFEKYAEQASKLKRVSNNTSTKIKSNNKLTNNRIIELHKVKHIIYVYNKNSKLIKTFDAIDSINAASNWAFAYLSPDEKLVASKMNIKNKIINAYLQNKTYKGYYWTIIVDNQPWIPNYKI